MERGYEDAAAPSYFLLRSSAETAKQSSPCVGPIDGDDDRERELRQKLVMLAKKREWRRSRKPKEGMQSVFENEATAGGVISMVLSVEDDTSEIDKAMDRVKREGLLNDRSFAEWYCLQRETYSPRSAQLLFMELSMKVGAMQADNE